jgi:hypothetical protein
MPSTLIPRIVESVTASMPPEGNGDPVDDPADVEMNGQGRGETTAPAKPRSPKRRKSLAASDKVAGRKFQIPDGVFERLQLHAIRRRMNPSTIVAELLNRELPRLEIIDKDRVKSPAE